MSGRADLDGAARTAAWRVCRGHRPYDRSRTHQNRRLNPHRGGQSPRRRNRRTSFLDSRHRPISPLPHRNYATSWLLQLTHLSSGSRHRMNMRQYGVVTSAVQPIFSPLVTSAVETERHVAAAGWDQPPRLFALVRAAGLLDREPHLQTQLGQGEEEGLTAIEQEGLTNTSSLESLLAQLAWPQEVDGVALAVERLVGGAGAAGGAAPSTPHD